MIETILKPEVMELIQTLLGVVVLIGAVYAFMLGKVYPSIAVEKTLERMEKLSIQASETAGRAMGAEIKEAMKSILREMEKNQSAVLQFLSSQQEELAILRKTVQDLQKMVGDRRKEDDRRDNGND